MSKEDTGKTFLEHHGVKGMKWGVRRAARKAARADKKWQNNIYSVRGAIAVHNAVADKMNNGGIAELNARNSRRRPPGNLNRPGAPTTRQYIADHNRMAERFTAEAVTSVHGISPSGKLRARYDPEEQRIIVESTEARHADDVLPTLTFELNVDEDGEITSVRKVRDVIEQTAFVGENFLNHHGVKGMKWGVRRSRRQLASESKSVKNMSDAELRAVVNRINMERQYAQLTSNGGANRKAKQILAAGATVNAVIAFSRSPAGRAIASALHAASDTSGAVGTIGRTVGVSRR